MLIDFFASVRTQLGSSLGHPPEWEYLYSQWDLALMLADFLPLPFFLLGRIFRERPYPLCFIPFRSEGLWFLTHTPLCRFPPQSTPSPSFWKSTWSRHCAARSCINPVQENLLSALEGKLVACSLELSCGLAASHGFMFALSGGPGECLSRTSSQARSQHLLFPLHWGTLRMPWKCFYIHSF